MRQLICFSILLILIQQPPNPFTIPFQPKIDLDNQDYLSIQKQLRAINIYPLISELYPDNQGYTTIYDFLARCSKGISQTLIDEEKGYFPILPNATLNNATVRVDTTYPYGTCYQVLL